LKKWVLRVKKENIEKKGKKGGKPLYTRMYNCILGSAFFYHFFLYKAGIAAHYPWREAPHFHFFGGVLRAFFMAPFKDISLHSHHSLTEHTARGGVFDHQETR
jgi:hypothetical protein